MQDKIDSISPWHWIICIPSSLHMVLYEIHMFICSLLIGKDKDLIVQEISKHVLPFHYLRGLSEQLLQNHLSNHIVNYKLGKCANSTSTQKPNCFFMFRQHKSVFIQNKNVLLGVCQSSLIESKRNIFHKTWCDILIKGPSSICLHSQESE